MKKIRRRLILPIATFAALGCLFAGRVSAQPLLATAGTASDACVDPMQSSCSRGTLYVVNGATLEVQSTLTLWQGVPNTFLQKLIVHPSGGFLYAAQSLGLTSPTSRWIDVIDLRTMTKVIDLRRDRRSGGDLARWHAAVSETPASGPVLDSATGSVLSSIPASSPTAVAIAPGGPRLYVAGGTFQAFSIAVLDGVTHALVDTIPVTNFVSQLELTADGLHLLALRRPARIRHRHDLQHDRRRADDFGGPSSPNALSIAGGAPMWPSRFNHPV